MKGLNFDFITKLRAIGAISVVISHIVFMYYPGRTVLPYPFIREPNRTSPFLSNTFTALNNNGFDFGPFGVALFFLISGYCICISLHKKDGFLRFWVRRLVRIYPAYIICFSLFFILSILYSKTWNGQIFPYSFKDWLIQVLILRDWFWNPNIDGVSWYLEVLMKFYLFMYMGALICRKLRINQTEVVIAITQCALGFLAILFQAAALYYNTGAKYPFAILYIGSFTCPFLAYALIGVAFFRYHNNENPDIRKLVLCVCCGLFGFVTGVYGGVLSINRLTYFVSYTLALLTFIALFSMRSSRCGTITRYVSRISYPLYVIQVCGYLLMSVLDWEFGISPYLNCVVTLFVISVLATIVESILSRQRKDDVGSRAMV